MSKYYFYFQVSVVLASMSYCVKGSDVLQPADVSERMNNDQHGSRETTLTIPKPGNKTLHCLFVLVYSNAATPPSNITKQDLDDINHGFMALALDLKSFNSTTTTYKFNLGNTSRTRCEVPSNNGAATGYDAVNREILDYKHYKLVVALVAVQNGTDGKNRVVFMTSKVTRFYNAPNVDTSFHVKDVAIGSAVAGVAVIIIIVWIVKRRGKKSRDPRPSVDYSLSEIGSGYTHVWLPQSGGTLSRGSTSATPSRNTKATNGSSTLDRRQDRSRMANSTKSTPQSYKTLPNMRRNKSDNQIVDLKYGRDTPNTPTAKILESKETKLDFDLGSTPESEADTSELTAEKISAADGKFDTKSLTEEGDLGRPSYNITPV